MAEPVSTGMAVTLFAASLAATAGATYMSVQSQRSAAKSQEALSKYNAQLQKKEAEERRLQGTEAAMLNRDKARRLMSINRAKIGTSGVTMAGSPLLNQLDIAETAEIDSANIMRNAQIGADQSIAQSRIDIMAGKSARTAGRLGVGASLFSGIGTMANTGLSYNLMKSGSSNTQTIKTKTG